MQRYPGGGAFALFFHTHPREFVTQDKKSANARGLARGGWAQLELTDALRGIQWLTPQRELRWSAVGDGRSSPWQGCLNKENF